MEDWLLIPSILFIIFIRLIVELFFRGGLYWFILLLSVVLVWLAAKLGWMVGWWRKLAGVVALFVVINIPFVWQPLRAYLYFNELCAKHEPLRVYEPIVLGPDDFYEDGWPKFVSRATGLFKEEDWGGVVYEYYRENRSHGVWIGVMRAYDAESGESRFEVRALYSGSIEAGLGKFYSDYVSGRYCKKGVGASRDEPLKAIGRAYIIKERVE